MAKEEKVIEVKVKNKKRRRFGVRTFFTINVRSWLAFDDIKDYGKNLVDLIKRLFHPQKSTRVETFDEAMARLNLTNADLVIKAKQFFRLALLYLGAAIMTFLYFLYLISAGYLMTAFLVLVLTALILSCALREHFWYMQITQRKLGCTFNDWIQFTFKNKSTRKTI